MISLINAIRDLAGAGTQTSALAFGGYVGGQCTEEYTKTSTLVQTLNYSCTTGSHGIT